MFTREVFVSDALIQEKAKNIQSMMNYRLPHENQLHLRFSNGWLYKFKKRNKFKMYRSHGEDGDADEAAIMRELSQLRAKNIYFLYQ